MHVEIVENSPVVVYALITNDGIIEYVNPSRACDDWKPGAMIWRLVGGAEGGD